MDKIDIVVASSNEHKISEIKKILKGLPFNILSKKEVGLSELETIEDKDTLEGNSLKKAQEISEKVNAIVIADDTGLFVDALDGRPGVYSARYAGENASDEDNNNKLLDELKEVPEEERTARFKTVISIVMKDKTSKTVEGECIGRIGLVPRGKEGFGYDPLFIVEEYNKSFAELGDDIKNKISHRANALRNLKSELERIFKEDK